MTTYRERERNRKRVYRSTRAGLMYSDDRPFVGVDGEGGTVPGSSHAYFLLRAGEEAITNEEGLSSYECLAFLSGLNPRPIYVGFFFDYDTTMICRDLGWERIYRLVHRELRHTKVPGRAYIYPLDVHDGEFQIDYLPRKFFKVRRRVGDSVGDGRPVFSPWVTVNDVGTFFQCRFTQALERWSVGSEDARDAISRGKDHRNLFSVQELPDIDKYNHLECRLLAELMTEFRAACKRSGYVPRHWQGPGQIAEAMFRARGIPKKKKLALFTDPANERLLMFAHNSFYGGRPEITRIGPVPGPVWQYDFNSAYPYAMLHLPCLVHGEWSHSDAKQTVKPETPLGLHYGHFSRRGNTRAYLFGLPVRREDGSIYYPAEGNGWYWSFEIAAAKHQVFTSRESFTYTRNCDCQPFRFLLDLYKMRLRIGKERLGLFLKLAMNSGYGKLAQSIGSPQYANPVWASFITAFTRAQIQDLIHAGPGHRAGRCGREALMVATDAVFTDTPLPVPDSREIGAVTVTEHPDGILLIQPGLYFPGNGGKPKTRGVPRSAVAEREGEFLDAWRRMVDTADENEGIVDIPVTTFIGLRQALHRNKIELAGTWIEYHEDGTANGKRIGFEYKTKRQFIVPPPPGVYTAAQTFPYVGGPDVITVPYSREIGRWREELRLDFEDQPDWVTMMEGISEDD